MTTDEQESPLHWHRSRSGTVRIDSDLNWEEFKDLLARVRQQDGETARVSAKEMVWAGPYEIYLAVQPLIDSAAGLVGAGTGVTALIMELARRKPDQPIHVHVENNVTIVVDGKRDLTPDETEAIEKMFREQSTDPNDPDWHPTGAGE